MRNLQDAILYDTVKTLVACVVIQHAFSFGADIHTVLDYTPISLMFLIYRMLSV